jgi:hypothetical protein
MILNINERLIILNILPQEGNILTLRILRKLKENLSFTEEEHKDLKLTVNPNNTISWRTVNDEDKPILQEKEFDIGDKASDLIKEALKKLDEDKKLTEGHMSVYDKFIGEEK